MAHHGIKAAKQGKSVYSTDIRDYVYWSKYPLLKEDASGFGTIEGTDNPNAPTTATINHNLGYNPIAHIYMEDPDNAGRYYKIRGDSEITVDNLSSDTNNITLKNYLAVDIDYFYKLYFDETLA